MSYEKLPTGLSDNDAIDITGLKTGETSQENSNSTKENPNSITVMGISYDLSKMSIEELQKLLNNNLLPSPQFDLIRTWIETRTEEASQKLPEPGTQESNEMSLEQLNAEFMLENTNILPDFLKKALEVQSKLTPQEKNTQMILCNSVGISAGVGTGILIKKETKSTGWAVFWGLITSGVGYAVTNAIYLSSKVKS